MKRLNNIHPGEILQTKKLESIYRQKNAVLDELKKSLLQKAYAANGKLIKINQFELLAA